MKEGVNHFRVDMRDLRFVLLEQFNTLELLGRGQFEDWGEEEIIQVMGSAERYSKEVAGPLNSAGDQHGCKLVDGAVKTPPGFRAGVKQLFGSGFKSLVASPDYGGTHAPKALALIITEMTAGANVALDMYAGLTAGAAELIVEFGTDSQKERFCQQMFEGEFCGTMCLTEPQAGSDVGETATQAEKLAEGSYRITGTKIFISGGDQDISDNIIHLVLARVSGAPQGTKGLSLFIVPKLRADGSLNDVTVGSIEHKMGLNGSSTCVLNFGDKGECQGELCGSVEGLGMRQMFQMMNFARIGVAGQGIGVASSAYLNALNYARERKQGPDLMDARNPGAPRVPILAHPDIRRVLLDMKARVEGTRAMIVKAGNHHDQASLESDEQRRRYHLGQVEFLTPLIKSYASDLAFELSGKAVQVCGGSGYVKDFPVEQYCRDSKIFAIYEGTNHIQALDLVFRKLTMDKGAHTQAFFGDIKRFGAACAKLPRLAPSGVLLQQAADSVAALALQFGTWGLEGVKRTALLASPFLNLLAEVCIGWLLLEAATIALAKLETLDEQHVDLGFYQGKLFAAEYFAEQNLAAVRDEARRLIGAKTAPLDIPDGAFATV